VNGLYQALCVVLPPCWMLCALLHGMAFGGPRAPKVELPRRAMLLATLGLHLVSFVVVWRLTNDFPVYDTWTTLSSVAFATGVLYAWIARRTRQEGSGGIILGGVFLLQLVASAAGDLAPDTREPMGAFRVAHVTTSVVAASALIFSGIHGILYLVLFRRMRERRFGPLFDHLPDLEQLARMTRSAAFAGFVFATLGLNLGIWLAHRYQIEGFDYTDPHVLVTLVLWLHFGVIAFSGHIRGITARRASFAATAGLVALLFSLFLTLFPALTFHATN
jgi:ABC-type uncharacterized transport system permease subunit